jgi:hypothetical protein
MSGGASASSTAGFVSYSSSAFAATDGNWNAGNDSSSHSGLIRSGFRRLLFGVGVARAVANFEGASRLVAFISRFKLQGFKNSLLKYAGQKTKGSRSPGRTLLTWAVALAFAQAATSRPPSPQQSRSEQP